MSRLTDRVAVITGGAAGIGAACAARLAAEGAAVVVADINDDAGTLVVDQISEAGGRATFVHMDVTDPLAWEALGDAVHQHYGPAQVVVSNAYLLIPGSATDLPLASWNAQLAVNLTGLFLAATTFAADLTATRGALIAMSSVHALFGMAERPAYAASKGGITALVRQLAVDYGPAVRVNAVLPGPVLTAAWDGLTDDDIVQAGRATTLGRIGTPAEVAAAVAFLASDDASFITGASLLVDGGWSITKDSP